MFIKNAWYVGALESEVDREPMGRVILNEPIVFFRKEDGTPVALEDRCCHRHYPLSHGELHGDRLQCSYHGMVYDATGACVEIPSQKQVPKGAGVRNYPVVERYHWVWIWMGDPELANPDEITDFHWLDDPNWGAKSTLIHIESNYKLIVENLLDLTHLAYVHRTTIGNDAVAEAADTNFDREPESVRVTRWIIDQPPPPAFVKSGGFTGNVDRWQIIDYSPPAFVRLDIGACDTGTGAPEGNRVGGIEMRNLNAITPETERSTHYFWGQAHSFDVKNENITNLVFDTVMTAFLEDKAIFEAQQRIIDMNPDANRINLAGDVGGVAATDIISRKIAEEAAA